MVRFVGIVLLIGLVAGCSPKQPVPVRIGYVETDVPSSSPCVGITGAFPAVSVTNGIFPKREGEL